MTSVNADAKSKRRTGTSANTVVFRSAYLWACPTMVSVMASTHAHTYTHIWMQVITDQIKSWLLFDSVAVLWFLRTGSLCLNQQGIVTHVLVCNTMQTHTALCPVPVTTSTLLTLVFLIHDSTPCLPYMFYSYLLRRVRWQFLGLLVTMISSDHYLSPGTTETM